MKKVLNILLMLSLPTAVYAADPPRLNNGVIAKFIDDALGMLIPIAGFIAFIFVVIGGYMWMVSGGDPARVKKAQGTLTWAFLGLAFVLLSVLIINLVTGFLGV